MSNSVSCLNFRVTEVLYYRPRDQNPRRRPPTNGHPPRGIIDNVAILEPYTRLVLRLYWVARAALARAAHLHNAPGKLARGRARRVLTLDTKTSRIESALQKSLEQLSGEANWDDYIVATGRALDLHVSKLLGTVSVVHLAAVEVWVRFRRKAYENFYMHHEDRPLQELVKLNRELQPHLSTSFFAELRRQRVILLHRATAIATRGLLSKGIINVTDVEARVLSVLLKAGRLMHQVDIAAAIDRDRRTIGRALQSLERRDLVSRPRGTNSGYGLTELGAEVARKTNRDDI